MTDTAQIQGIFNPLQRVSSGRKVCSDEEVGIGGTGTNNVPLRQRLIQAHEFIPGVVGYQDGQVIAVRGKFLHLVNNPHQRQIRALSGTSTISYNQHELLGTSSPENTLHYHQAGRLINAPTGTLVTFVIETVPNQTTKIVTAVITIDVWRAKVGTAHVDLGTDKLSVRATNLADTPTTADFELTASADYNVNSVTYVVFSQNVPTSNATLVAELTKLETILQSGAEYGITPYAGNTIAAGRELLDFAGRQWVPWG